MRLFCYRCGKYTNHTVLAEKKIRSNPDYEDHWGEDHYFGECAGCDAITYAISSWHESDWNPHTGEPLAKLPHTKCCATLSALLKPIFASET